MRNTLDFTRGRKMKPTPAAQIICKMCVKKIANPAMNVDNRSVTGLVVVRSGLGFCCPAWMQGQRHRHRPPP